MRLTKFESEMLTGACGQAAKWALEFQMRVGNFFDAPDFVEVRMVQLTSDIEVIGDSGLKFLQHLHGFPKNERLLRTFAVADARGLDVAAYKTLLPERDLATRTEKVMNILVSLGAMPAHAVTNYHSIPPVGFGEHCSFSGTPQVIYVNSIQGGRSNFEAGPAGIAAMFTGRVPRYGFHLDSNRMGSRLFRLKHLPENPTEWGALGAIIGRRTGSYWSVPVIEGVSHRPSILDLNHFGVALASYGSAGMFHMVGVTPESASTTAAFNGRPPAAEEITRADLMAFFDEWHGAGEKLDLVVLGAPQLCFSELQLVGDLLKGRRLRSGTLLLAYTSQELKEVCARSGIEQSIREAGGMLIHGPCFFQVFAREVGEYNKLNRLMTHSAKMANLTAGFGYRPSLGRIEQCVQSAISGKIL